MIHVVKKDKEDPREGIFLYNFMLVAKTGEEAAEKGFRKYFEYLEDDEKRKEKDRKRANEYYAKKTKFKDVEVA